MVAQERILLFGADGFIGNAISKELPKFNIYLGLNRENLDVREQPKVKQAIQDFKPTIVINATGKVAGIQGNIDSPARLMRENSENILSITKVCHDLKIEKMIQFASACVYPLNDSTSSRPEDLGTGVIEQTSKGYAISKIFGIELFNSYRKQFGYKWSTIIPTNLYGDGDWHNDANGHVIAMLARKFVEAKRKNLPHVEIWGDGKSLRNFLNVIDLAEATSFFISKDLFDKEIINISGEREVSIKELALIIKDVVGFEGEIIFNKNKPNGARRKNLNDNPIRKLGWNPKMNLVQGISDYVKKLETLIL